ncbi:hypothetical protein GGR21_003164 [Dysgonomonas hofstadii]|uniref:Fimbrillin family protein n=1 Tax=Dysgonomonas hofstadii TaxID=637886 RepID=A0A840CMG8_9BACT|nr:fimbrillin family protein [Dysgonomonas hofstadii]MBB4037247.1 hypothetical protein [Dysgonomonas hofstadii]
MKSIKYIYTVLLILLLSCSNDEGYLDNGNEGKSETPASAVKFNLGFQASTKVATDEAFQSIFENGDEVGLFVVKEGEILQATGNYEDNRKLVYNGTNWQLEGDDIFYPTDGTNLSVYAYYPYQDGTNPTDLAFEAGTDQNNAAGYSASDFLLAKAENQTEANINLPFSHTMALIHVEVVRGKNLASITSALEMNLHSCMTSFISDWSTLKATVKTGTVNDIKMLRVENSLNAHIYRALVPAQTIVSGTKLFSFVQTTNGSEIDNIYTTAAETELVAGKVTKWKITLNGEELPEHNYQVGDVYPFTGTPIGIVFEISNEGKNGKIVSLKENQQRWGANKDESADGVPTIRDVNDGKTASQNLVEKRRSGSNFATDYAVFSWLLNTMNESNVYGEWYMPAKNELRSLVAGMSGLTYSQIVNTWTDGNSMPDFTAQACVDARTAFNTKIKNAGGTEMNITNGQYWASTEADATFAWSVHLETGKIHATKRKDDAWGRLRPIMQF